MHHGIISRLLKEGWAVQGRRLTALDLGNHELLAPDYTHHVVLQGGELPRGQETAQRLHVWILGGKFTEPDPT